MEFANIIFIITINTTLFSFKENKSGDNDSDEHLNESINKSSDESQSKY